MTQNIIEKIKNDINDNKIIIYMKGTPVLPQCGFSSMAVKILEHCNVKYKSVNVLDNIEVREGIKKFSDWPTIPQLYVDGEFIGGSDIMKEMFEVGELQELLSVKT